MRLPYILLVALVTSLPSLSVEANAGTRTLRSLKTSNSEDAAEEERVLPVVPFQHTFNFNAMDEVLFKFIKLPEQFERMRTQPERLRTILKDWYDTLQSVDDIVAFMKKQNLSPKAIEEFKGAYEAYIKYAKSINVDPAFLALH